MFKKVLLLILTMIVFVSSDAYTRGPKITMNKRVWKIGDNIEVKASGLDSSKKYVIGAFKRKTSDNSSPIKRRMIKKKAIGSVYFKLNVPAGKYEFHLYFKKTQKILSKVNLVLKSGGTNPPVNPPVNPPTGNKNFTTSSATTDLNYADTVTFGKTYSALGYKHLKYAKKVTKSQLISLLGQRNNMHFHSGHGSTSGAVVCNDSDLSPSSLSGKIQVQYSIYCICDAFRNSAWGKTLGSNGVAVMGFKNLTYDDSCLDLAKSFPSQLKSTKSYPMAWYKANASISDHKDRWVMFVKEGGKVVQYKAGGNTPKQSFKGKLIYLSDSVGVDNILFRKWKRDSFGRSSSSFLIRKSSLRINRSGKWPTKSISFSYKEALDKALLLLGDDLPENARLESILPIKKCKSNNTCVTVAYDIHFIPVHNGLKVRSNSSGNRIAVLIGDSNKVSVEAQWPEVYSSLVESFDVSLSAGVALEIAADDISNIARQSVVIADYEKVYGVKTTKYGDKIIVPAYEFIGVNGGRFVVSALDGALIK